MICVTVFSTVSADAPGYVAEIEGRNWLSFEERKDYLSASIFRFMQNEPVEDIKKVYLDLIEEKNKKPFKIKNVQPNLI